VKKLRQGLLEAFILAVVAGLILFSGWGLSKAGEARKSYTPTNLIRLHIIGNSDETWDQEVKLKVRDAILDAFGERLQEIKDVREAEAMLREALPEIERLARECLKKEGFSYDARARITYAFSPDKTYETRENETILLPSGIYKSLQVILGQGRGHNWWCIMYPPLCYLDFVKETLDLEPRMSSSDSEPKEAVPAGWDRAADIKILVDELNTKEVPTEVRFFLIEVLKKGSRYLTRILPARFSLKMCPATLNEP